MKLNNYIKNYKLSRQLLKFLKKIYGYNHIMSIYLFGSSARGDSTDDSDIDILIITENGFESPIKNLVFSKEFFELDKIAVENFSGGLQILTLDLKLIEKSFDTLPNKLLAEGKLLFGLPISDYIDIEKLNANNKPDPKLFFEELKKIQIPF